jgi:hypothetical protein
MAAFTPPAAQFFLDLPSSDSSNAIQTSIMPPRTRSAGRNVHIYDAANKDEVLGGLRATQGVTNATFYMMMDVLVEFSTQQFHLLHESEMEVPIERNDNPLQLGKYYIVSAGNHHLLNMGAQLMH